MYRFGAQITRHDCVEGWSAIGAWSGVPLGAFLKLAAPDGPCPLRRSSIVWIVSPEGDPSNT